MVLEFNPNHIDSIIDSMVNVHRAHACSWIQNIFYNGASYTQFKLPIV